MIFVTGPLFSGKREYIENALHLSPEVFAARAVWDVEQLAASAPDLEKLAERLAAHEIVTASEVGGGVVPLSDAGRVALRQAEFRPDTVYVSPLSRARETAAILCPEAEQIAIPDLREMDFGAFEGRTAGEMADDPAYRAWVEGNCAGRCPGGESMAEFSGRVWAAFANLVATEPEQLVIVAHGGVQMAILERYARPHRDYFHWHAPCGGGFVLDGPDLIGEVQY